MVRTVRHECLLLLAIGLVGITGCLGGSQNPSRFPYFLPAGDIIRTHAKPPGLGYFANFDPKAVKLEVRPFEGTNPVRAQQVLIATIYDETGKPRRARRVEWMVEGVGNIVEVDESGYAPGRGYKVDNKYAVSYTDYCEHRITRGTADPNDDFVIRPGQTWCVVSSAVEGDTHVTIYAPEIADWSQHKVFVTHHWVDAEWTLPPPSVSRIGGEQVLTTNVFRSTDKQPLANYGGRYRVVDGPPASFMPARSAEAVATSDLSGRASVTVAQTAPQAGVNRIGIEIIRPPDPTAPSGSGIVIGRGETTIDWQGPQLALAVTGPPTASVEQEVPYTITITNSGQVETQAMTVRAAIPEGLQLLSTQPRALVEGQQLTWTLGVLPGGQASTIQAIFRSTRVGPVQFCANLTSVENLRSNGCANTQVTAPELKVGIAGPQAAMVGVPLTFQITLTNPGTGPATNAVLTAAFSAGLTHESSANPVELPVGTLEPRAPRTIPLVLTPRQAGQLTLRVSAKADGNLTEQAEYTVNAQQASLDVEITGPAQRYAETPAVFDIRVMNPADVALSNVNVRAVIPEDLGFVSATGGGQADRNQVTWNVGILPAKEHRDLKLTTNALRPARRAVVTVVTSADGGLQAQKDAAIEILGAAAFDIDLRKQGDPVEKGGRVTYQVIVTNRGTLAADQVEIVAKYPAQMKVVSPKGPTAAIVNEQQREIRFAPVASVPPRQVLTYTIEVEALQAALDVRFGIELRSPMLKSPILKEESTTILDAGQAPRLPPPAPQNSPTLPPAAPGGSTTPAPTSPLQLPAPPQ